MAVVGLFCQTERSRRDLTLAIEELGHRVAAAAALKEAVDVMARAHPQLMVVAAEGSTGAAETFLGEAERLHPLLPVVVAMEPRDATRAVEFLRAGACEVVAPPWTRENLSACLSKALRLRGTVLDAVRPAPPGRGAVVCLAAAAAVFVAVLGLRSLELKRRRSQLAQAPPRAAWELPYSHPSGLAYKGGEFWISDWYAQAVYRHDAGSLALTRAIPFPKETPVALTFAADALWTVSASGVITKHMLDDRLTRLGSVKDAFQHSVGIVYDGLYLWTCDTKDRRIHKHLMDDEFTIVASYEYPGVKPAALAFDGKSLWSIDAGNRELLRHSVESPSIVAYRAALPPYQTGRWRPTGLAWDGERFWSVAEPIGAGDRAGRIFRHDVPPPAESGGGR